MRRGGLSFPPQLSLHPSGLTASGFKKLPLLGLLPQCWKCMWCVALRWKFAAQKLERKQAALTEFQGVGEFCLNDISDAPGFLHGLCLFDVWEMSRWLCVYVVYSTFLLLCSNKLLHRFSTCHKNCVGNVVGSRMWRLVQDHLPRPDCIFFYKSRGFWSSMIDNFNQDCHSWHAKGGIE